jgi:hypothetical protein
MMNYNIKRHLSEDEIRICRQDTCIEARGDNARIIIAAIAIVLICYAILQLSRIK